MTNTMGSDTRWKQRLQNYQKALLQLKTAVALRKQRELNDVEKQGLIKAFEFTYELAWNVMEDYLAFQGITAIIGSRDAFREAFKRGLIDDGATWMEMIESRNQSSHTYNDGVAKKIEHDVVELYFELFVHFEEKMAEFVK